MKLDLPCIYALISSFGNKSSASQFTGTFDPIVLSIDHEQDESGQDVAEFEPIDQIPGTRTEYILRTLIHLTRKT